MLRTPLFSDRSLLTLLVASLCWASGSNASAEEHGAGSPSELKFTAGEWPPYSGAQLPYKGLMPRIARAAFEAEEYPISLHFFPWAQALTLARKRSWDGAIGFAHTDSRAEHFLYSDPIAYSITAFFHRRSLDFSWDDYDDILNFKVGVVREYSYGARFDQFAQEHSERVTVYESDRAALMALAAGEIDLFPIDLRVGEYLLSELFNETPELLVADEKPVVEYGLSVIFPASHPQSSTYKHDFNRGLKTIKSTGLYDRLIEQYEDVLALAPLTIYTEEFAPLNYVEKGKLDGVSSNIMRAILTDLGIEKKADEIEVLPWRRVYRFALESHNAIVFSMTKTQQRESLFKWVGPIYRSKNALISYTKNAINPRSVEDLNKLKICVTVDGVSHQELERLQVAPQNLTLASYAATCAKLLQRGRVDGWAADIKTGRWYLERAGEPWSQFRSSYVLNESAYYVAFNRHIDDRVVRLFQKSLDKLKANGRYGAIVRDYFGAEFE